MFLLDTNVLSNARKKKAGKANRGVIQFMSDTPTIETFISVITVMEIRQGSLLLERKDPKQASVYLDWLESEIMPAFEGRIIPVTTEIALECAALHVPDKQPANDALIAATAKVKGLTVVTSA
ncbi:MAG: VapC toxin family PIN domain ribonuclease [Gammaproteobacteria bacterium]|nr:MAG: VapC toxin family PIN domain ribonuclease [Gammaproteobacteria bacterium]